MKTAPFIVHCDACRHEWSAAWTPMKVDLFVKVARRAICPKCASTKVFCGKAPTSMAENGCGNG